MPLKFTSFILRGRKRPHDVISGTPSIRVRMLLD